MKKITLFFVMLLTSLVVTFAQGDPMAPLPMDPTVRMGKLENGLTYYIKHNEMPAERADFYIVSHVGALQEKHPEQDGLAHFLEHMAFNGLKSLPGKTMFTYLEGIGAEFGRNINAWTGLENTCYMLNNIPMVREGVVDTCLLILHDWSCAIENLDSEINNERQVIIEERRTTNSAGRRMMFERFKAVFGEDHKFANTSLIGSQENLETFDPQSLRDFYATWYRPDLQAIIVVGDIDVDQIENKIKERFSDLKMPENPQPKPVYDFVGNIDPTVRLITDPEATSTEIEVAYKHAPIPREIRPTAAALINDIVIMLSYQMFNERMNDIAMSANPPFIGANAYYQSYSEFVDVFSFSATSKEGEVMGAYRALLEEMQRAKTYGFTAAEYERATTSFLRSLQSDVDSKDTRRHSYFFNEYLAHFTENQPYLDPEYTYELVQGLLPMIPVEAINQLLPQLMTQENMVIMLSGPKKEGLTYPSEQELLDLYNESLTWQVEAPVQEEVITDLMIGVDVVPGTIVKEKEGQYGSTIYELSNGITVYYKQTENSKDNFSFSFVQKGGTSMVSDEDIVSFDQNILGIYQQFGGLSQFSANQLQKALTGNVVSVWPSFGSREHGVSGSASPKNADKAFQLMYLTYVAPRFEASELENGLSMLKNILPNYENQPDYKYSIRLNNILYSNPRFAVLTSEMLDKVDLTVLEKNYRKLFSGVKGGKLYIVGDITPEVLEPLLEQYVAALPKGKATKEVKIDRGYPKADVIDSFRTQMESPKTTVGMIWLTDVKYSLRNEILASMLNSALDLTYTKTVREEAGGTYGVGTSVSISSLDKKNNGMIIVQFDTNEDKVAELKPIVIKGLEDIAANGISAEYMTKILENMNKVYKENQISNGYWSGLLKSYYGQGIEKYDGYVELLNSLTSDDIKEFTAEMLKNARYIECVMNPEK